MRTKKQKQILSAVPVFFPTGTLFPIRYTPLTDAEIEHQALGRWLMSCGDIIASCVKVDKTGCVHVEED